MCEEMALVLKQCLAPHMARNGTLCCGIRNIMVNRRNERRYILRTLMPKTPLNWGVLFVPKVHSAEALAAEAAEKDFSETVGAVIGGIIILLVFIAGAALFVPVS